MHNLLPASGSLPNCRRDGVSAVTEMLNIPKVFRIDAEELQKARQKASVTHGTDIKAAGNHVEQAVRDYLRRMLASRYHVTAGHLIDSEGRTSPQIDVIIADNSNLPSLLTTSDGTEYIPIKSVYAIGEVKTTYYQSKQYFKRLHEVLSEIAGMNRPLVENTNRDGITDSTTLLEMARPRSPNKYWNNLFSFMICLEGGDFNFTTAKKFLTSVSPELLPGLSVMLDMGIVSYARRVSRGLQVARCPNEVSPSDYDWCFVKGKMTEDGSLEGTHLAVLYGALIDHLTGSYLEPPVVYEYTGQMSKFEPESLTWARE